jgi:hypothetical protein
VLPKRLDTFHTAKKFQSSWQGCQIFLDAKYQNGEKYTKLPQHYPMAMKYDKVWKIF